MQILPALLAAMLMFGPAAALAAGDDDKTPPRRPRADFGTISDGTSNTVIAEEEEEDMIPLVVEPTECIVEMNGITTRCSETRSEELAPTGVASVPHIFSAPTGLSIANAGSNSLRFTWQDNSNNEDGFVIERLLPMTSATAPIATVRGAGESMGSRSHTVRIQGARSRFCYRVRATRGSAITEPTERACAALR